MTQKCDAVCQELLISLFFHLPNIAFFLLFSGALLIFHLCFHPSWIVFHLLPFKTRVDCLLMAVYVNLVQNSVNILYYLVSIKKFPLSKTLCYCSWFTEWSYDIHVQYYHCFFSKSKSFASALISLFMIELAALSAFL